MLSCVTEKRVIREGMGDKCRKLYIGKVSGTVHDRRLYICESIPIPRYLQRGTHYLLNDEMVDIVR